MLLGVISDTHGKLDERALLALRGVDAIVHAGDICADSVLYELEAVAPVTAVLGNCDRDRGGVAGFSLGDVARFGAGGTDVLVVHEKADLGTVPEGVSVVVYGHSHLPLVQRSDGVLWVNPGSATQPRRSKIGRSIALIAIEDGVAEARIVALDEVEPS